MQYRLNHLNHKKTYFWGFLALAGFGLLVFILPYSNNFSSLASSSRVADNLQAIWPSPNDPSYCQQILGSGWESLGWDGYSNIQYCAHTTNFNSQTSTSLIDNVQAVWPSINSGVDGGNIDCRASVGSDWQAMGYDGTSNITFCKHFSPTSLNEHNFIDGIKSVYPSLTPGLNGGTDDCRRALGWDWLTFGYNGNANTTYCKHFASLALSSTPTSNALPNLTVQLPDNLNATAGTSFSITANIVNNGPVKAQTNSWTQTAFSGPGLPAEGKISGFSVSALEANASYNQSLNFTPPQAGTYYVGVCVDVSRQVTESEENNNDNCKTATINVGSGGSAGNINNTLSPSLSGITLNPSSFVNNTSGGITNIQVTFNNPQNYNRLELLALGGNNWFTVPQNPYNWLISSGFTPGTYTAQARACSNSTNTCSDIKTATLTVTGQTQQTNTSNNTNNTTQNNNTQTNNTSANQAPTAVTNTATGITQTSAVLNATVNPNNSPATAWFEYGTTPSLGNQAGSQSVGSSSSNINFSSSLSNLQANTTYYFRVVAQNSYGTVMGSILSFTTSFQQTGQQSGSTPSAITNSATGIGQNFVTFNGTANPNNSSTEVLFEYGTTASLGNQTSSQSIGGSASNINFSYSVSGLQANTTYYFRAVAQNSYGTARGSILSFTTSFQQSNQQNTYNSAPTVYTNPHSGVGSTYVTLQGSANPNNLSTNAWFEYGTTPSLGLATSFSSVGSGSSFVNFSKNVNNLLPNTVYYYRAVAENSSGIAYGNILSFNTGTSYSYSSANYYYPTNYQYQQYQTNNNGRLPTVATRSASSIFQNVAILNGSVVPNNLSTSAWFEWGTSSSLTNSTLHQTLAGGYNSLDFSNYITGLTPNTTYYYQAVAENAQGQARGSLLTFRTTALPQVTPITTTTYYTAPSPAQTVIQQPTPKETAPLKVSLILTIDKKEIRAGDIVNLTAVYINDDDSPIHDAVLKISFPEEAEYQNASIMPNSVFPSQTNFPIGTLGAHSQGAINIRAAIKSNVTPGNNLIWNFTLDYKDKSNGQHSISNFVTVKIPPTEIGGLAALLGAGSGFWTFLFLLLVAILVLTSFYFFYKAVKINQKKDNPI